MALSVTGAPILRVQDINNGALGEVVVTFKSDGKKMNAMHTISASTSVSYDKNQLGVLGTTMKGNRKLGSSGSGQMSLYDITTEFRRRAEIYQDTGVDEYFDMQIIQYDPSSNTGRQSITYYDCNFDSLVLSQLDINSSELTCDMDFTFERYHIDDEYDPLDGLFAA